MIEDVNRDNQNGVFKCSRLLSNGCTLTREQTALLAEISMSIALFIFAFDDFDQLCKIKMAEKMYYSVNN